MDYPYAHRSSLGIIRRMETRRITLTNDVAETRRVPTPVSGARPVARTARPLSFHSGPRGRGADLAIPFHPPVRGRLRRHATPISHPGAPGRRQAPPCHRALFGDRCLYGSRLFEPGELQRPLHAEGGRAAVCVSTPRSRPRAGARHPSRRPDAGMPDAHVPPPLVCVFPFGSQFSRSLTQTVLAHSLCSTCGRTHAHQAHEHHG